MSDDPRRHQEAAAAAAGALLGAVVGGPAGGIVGAAAAPYLVPFAEKIWAEIRPEVQTRGAAVLGAAAEARDVDPEQLVAEVLAGTEEQRLLALLALNAAAQTANRGKIRGLGRALANGLVDDQAIVDEQLMIVRALEDLETPHLGVLDMMATSFWRASWGSGQLEPLARYDIAPRDWPARHIADARPGVKLVLPTILGALERHGLIVRNDNTEKALEVYSKEMQNAARLQNLTKSGGMPSLNPGSLSNKVKGLETFRISELGLQLLDYVRSAAEDDPDVQQPRPSED